MSMKAKMFNKVAFDMPVFIFFVYSHTEDYSAFVFGSMFEKWQRLKTKKSFYWGIIYRGGGGGNPEQVGPVWLHVSVFCDCWFGSFDWIFSSSSRRSFARTTCTETAQDIQNTIVQRFPPSKEEWPKRTKSYEEGTVLSSTYFWLEVKGPAHWLIVDFKKVLIFLMKTNSLFLVFR